MIERGLLREVFQPRCSYSRLDGHELALHTMLNSRIRLAFRKTSSVHKTSALCGLFQPDRWHLLIYLFFGKIHEGLTIVHVSSLERNHKAHKICSATLYSSQPRIAGVMRKGEYTILLYIQWGLEEHALWDTCIIIVLYYLLFARNEVLDQVISS